MLIYSTILYYVLSLFFGIWHKKIDYHSLIHSCVASGWITYALFYYSKNRILDIDIPIKLMSISLDQKTMFKTIIEHSLGYYLADTTYILFNAEKKKRIYINHHLSSILGLSIVFYDSFLSVYAAWILNVGGVVHHLKHISEVYDFKSKSIFQYSYFIIYLFSRILLTINTTNMLINISKSQNKIADIIGLSVGFFLIIENFKWWWINVQKKLKK